jgi:hypothetical protein
MNLPLLEPEERDREFNETDFDEISNLLWGWLFTTNQSYRYLDEQVLNCDYRVTKGFRSMNILHHLGLGIEFKGIFKGMEASKAIKLMENDSQDFTNVIEYLKKSNGVIKVLRDVVYSQDDDFQKNYKEALSNIDETDRASTTSAGRNEQALLRVHLFGSNKEKICCLCHKVYPVNLMVTAHIKPRKLCSHQERVDLNIVMPVCKIGCDDLFERGYLKVENEGKIEKNLNIYYSEELDDFMEQYKGKKCKSYNNNTRKYFNDKNKITDKEYKNKL